MDRISLLVVLVPALPLAAAILAAVLGPRLLRQQSHWPVIVAIAASFVCSLGLLSAVNTAQEASRASQLATPAGPQGYEQIVRLWTWAAVDRAYDQSQPVGPDSEGSSVQTVMRNFRVDIVLRADALTAMMLSMVTFVSMLVAIFASGYMHGDSGYWRFFAYIGLFVFSMTMLVSVSNFVLLYVFWEAVGVCSYLLIGFWYEKPEAVAAGKKAFLVNRVGDFGFALGLFLIWTTYGTLNFHDTLADGTGDQQAVAQAVLVQQQADAESDEPAEQPDVVRGVLGLWRIADNQYVGGGIGLAICLLLLLGACGKSAQFPLHVWLPDAMEGPTPVSALIHAATMVTAGVYMVARCTPLFMVSPEAQLVVACVGGFTALLAGLIALTQFDLKRVLAYSTVSQLGYMFLGLGAGTFAGITSGMFHLFTHAFFKALLFLGAGSVMHAMGNIIDMRRFGGLRKIMPITHATFAIGCLALAGIPFFSGFWSKDSIVAAVHERAHELEHRHEHDGQEGHEGAGQGGGTEHARVPGSLVAVAWQSAAVDDATRTDPLAGLTDGQLQSYASIYQWLYYLAMFTAFLTAFYTFRAFYLTFYGERQIPPEAGDHAHESPRSMTVPLVILAICAALAGFCFDRTYRQAQPTHVFAEFLSHAPSLAGGPVAGTKQPYEFHTDVAGVSSAIALLGLLLSTYLYLGSHREIRWIRSMLDFEWVSQQLDVETVSRWKQLRWIDAIHRGACAAHLGWVTATIGYITLLVVLLLTTPLVLGSYLSPYKLSFGKFFFDELYQLTIVLPLRGLAAVCYLIDRWLIDGLVDAVGRIPPAFGSLMRSLQMGLVQFYALAMVLAMLVLIVGKMIWAAG